MTHTYERISVDYKQIHMFITIRYFVYYFTQFMALYITLVFIMQFSSDFCISNFY